MLVPGVLAALGFNHRPLTYPVFEDTSRALGVEVLRADTPTPGMYFVQRGKPFIGLSTRLSGVQLWYVAWHEMAHHLLHAPGLRCFSPRSVSKAEAEADDIALCAVIDDETLYRIIAFGELHDFPQKMMKARMKILERRIYFERYRM